MTRRQLVKPINISQNEIEENGSTNMTMGKWYCSRKRNRAPGEKQFTQVGSKGQRYRNEPILKRYNQERVVNKGISG